MNNSNSGIISTEFVNVSDSFSDYTDISHNNHNRLVKAKRFGKWYMLKGLNAKYTDQAVFVELLRKEFDMGISLDHPNVIRTIGKESDSFIGDCVVLEYIDGTTLGEWLKTTPSKNERRRVIVQLLDAMNYFHAKGVIHRDLKPDNILITRNGANVKVIDFGLSDSDEYAILKQPVGSRRYSAPEQAEEGGKIDLRADIYAFGVVLQEFGLTGVYKRVARKATQKSPSDRYANTLQILSILQHRRQIHLAAAIVVAICVVGLGGFSVLRSESMSMPLLPLRAQFLTTDTVIREVLRDTIVTIKEIPVVVEKVVLKDVGESDTTYIARKKWEQSIKQRITAEYKKLYTPIVEQYRKALSLDDIQQIGMAELSMKLAKFNTDMMSEVGADNEFYSEMVHFLASAGLPYNIEIAAIIERVQPPK